MPKNGDFRKNLLDRKNVQERMVLFFFMGKRLMEHGDAMMNLRQGILKGLSSINGNVIGTVVIILCELKNLYWLVECRHLGPCPICFPKATINPSLVHDLSTCFPSNILDVRRFSV